MSLLPFCRWLASTEASIALHQSLYAYPLIESIHVLTLTVFVGLAGWLDLRLLGLSLRNLPVSEMVRRLLPWMQAGFTIMVASGILLFYAIPVRSYQNVFFRAKLVFLVLAGLNVWIFHSGIYRSIDQWDRAAQAPRRARLAGAASLILWACIIVAGRLIAYNWFDCDIPQGEFIRVVAGCTTEAQP
jgi:uncharacterized protein DUF6644